MRRVINDALISVGALVVLLVGLVSVDDRMRERLGAALSAPPNSAQIINAGDRIGEVSRVMFIALRDQSVEHAPLVIFAVAATVLVLFMVRT
ncbi:MAG TPA: hypothetical protein VFO58_14360 [Vicinamibacterales bacterium]|nr:hypothetical protein [Vicinamibacterales bacterium]